MMDGAADGETALEASSENPSRGCVAGNLRPNASLRPRRCVNIA